MNMEKLTMIVEQFGELLNGLVEILKGIIESLRESGVMEFASAAYVAREIRENRHLERIESACARATRMHGRTYLIETDGPIGIQWKVVIE